MQLAIVIFLSALLSACAGKNITPDKKLGDPTPQARATESVMLDGEDCVLFNTIEAVTGGRILYQLFPGDGPSSKKRCLLRVSPAALRDGDKKIAGFGGTMILIISEKGSYERLFRYTGRGNLRASRGKVGTLSLNERVYSTPLFSVQCESQERVCQIILAPSGP